MAQAPSREPVLAAHGVRKAFGGTTALDGVSFALDRGEIHALVGGNGCGKSTLMKILAGVVPADEGSVELECESFDLKHFSTGLARRQGLHFVHQETSTFGDMTVADNLAIGRGFETDRFGRIRWRAVHRRVQEVLDRFGVKARPGDRLAQLRPATQTMVAIARALQDQAGEHSGVLALDEPTASLPPEEVEVVLTALRAYAERGQSIVFISHRMDEVFAVADRITVFRDGHDVAVAARAGLEPEHLIELIVGGTVEMPPTRPPAAPESGTPALEARGLCGGPLVGVDLRVAAGELVGIAGINGSGRSTLLRMLFGVDQPTAGEVRLEGKEVRFSKARDAIDAGVAYVPEDRTENGLFLEMSVAENLTGGAVAEFSSHGAISHRRERRYAEATIERFLIRAESPDVEVATLSGGNQQKIVLARWLRKRPRVLLLDEPTHGVDVGARAELSRLIREAVDEGTAVLAVSSDFEELVELCDRVVVLRDGVLDGELAGPELSLDRLNHLMHAERTPG